MSVVRACVRVGYVSGGTRHAGDGGTGPHRASRVDPGRGGPHPLRCPARGRMRDGASPSGPGRRSRSRPPRREGVHPDRDRAEPPLGEAGIRQKVHERARAREPGLIPFVLRGPGPEDEGHHRDRQKHRPAPVRRFPPGRSTNGPRVERSRKAGPDAGHGPHWEGKVCDHLGESPRTLRRWRDGEGAPSTRTMAWCREWAMRTAADLLDAAGEADLAGDVRDRLRSLDRRAVEKGHAAFMASRAQSPVEN